MQNQFEPQFLREAIRLSKDQMEANAGGPFGAVIVRPARKGRPSEIIGRGWNQVTSSFDPTAHAEVTAIRDACQQLHSVSLAGCEIYTSCEPCPMCLAAILWARLDRIYFAAGKEDAARAGFDDAVFYKEITKPLEQRIVPMEQQLRSEAVAVFDAWLAKPDRIPY
jgi:tRNA(Arg) A34 adenosine deaminase TadA